MLKGQQKVSFGLDNVHEGTSIAPRIARTLLYVCIHLEGVNRPDAIPKKSVQFSAILAKSPKHRRI